MGGFFEIGSVSAEDAIRLQKSCDLLHHRIFFSLRRFSAKAMNIRCRGGGKEKKMSFFQSFFHCPKRIV